MTLSVWQQVLIGLLLAAAIAFLYWLASGSILVMAGLLFMGWVVYMVLRFLRKVGKAVDNASQDRP